MIANGGVVLLFPYLVRWRIMKNMCVKQTSRESGLLYRNVLAGRQRGSVLEKYLDHKMMFKRNDSNFTKRKKESSKK